MYRQVCLSRKSFKIDVKSITFNHHFQKFYAITLSGIMLCSRDFLLLIFFVTHFFMFESPNIVHILITKNVFMIFLTIFTISGFNITT